MMRWEIGVRALAFFLILGTAAQAAGTTRVQQSDGSVQVYHDVRIRLHGHTLWLRSPDRKDRLQVESTACSYVHEIQRCLPYKVFLHKPSGAHQITIVRGVYYVNLTDKPHPLLHSSERVPAKSVLMFLHTSHGTFVQAEGRLDAVE